MYTVVGLAAGDDSSNPAKGIRPVKFVGLLLQEKFRLFGLEAVTESLEKGGGNHNYGTDTITTVCPHLTVLP